MEICLAAAQDLEVLLTHDRHVSREILTDKIAAQQVLILWDGDAFAGWLRWSLFWDEHPFMNLLFLLEPYRGKGYGRLLVEDWERRCALAGYSTVMTSTQANECAQFFYRQLGYEDIGAFALPGDPLELILSKAL